MGLDMHLTGSFYLSTSRKKEDKLIGEINKIFGFPVVLSASVISFKLGYWRKANHIHQWFVDNVQNGVDECQEAYVSQEDLEALKCVCQQALTNPEQAAKLLPTQGGFFFGSTDYGEYYFQNIKDTIKIIDEALKHTATMEFYYRSSW